MKPCGPCILTRAIAERSPVGYVAEVALGVRVRHLGVLDAGDGEFVRRPRKAAIASASLGQRGGAGADRRARPAAALHRSARLLHQLG